MTNHRVGFRAAIVIFIMGIFFFMSGSVSDPAREIAEVQKAIAAEKLKWQAGVTSLSALSREERQARLGGRLSEVPVPPGARLRAHEVLALPAKLDWRNHGGNWITSVKDQGHCGSCWAFAPTSVLEAMVKIKKNLDQNIDLAEQMLLSCSGAGNCIDGGYEYMATQYIKTTGIPNESCYPYTASVTPCNPCSGWAERVVRITSWEWVGSTAEAVEAALQHGPITSWMGVYSDFYHYTGGVYQPTSGSTYEGGHFVAIIGYNHDDKYWICKNSWGTGWGESGFFRIHWGAAGIGGQVLRMIGPVMDNKAPVLQHVPDLSGEEGKTMTFALSASDGDGDALQFSADGLPEGAVLDATSGAFSWTPTFTQSGAYSIRFRVSDGFAVDEQTVIVSVVNVKHVQW